MQSAAIKELKDFISQIASEFEEYDALHPNLADRQAYVLERKYELFGQFNRHFSEVWGEIENGKEEEIKGYQKKFQEILREPLLEAEINKYIKLKPLGYPGDFVMMNYIYDYHEKLLGESSLEMLINHYTTNIPISRSNILRKRYFKRRIAELLTKKDNPSAVSIGCGSARELIELLEEGKVNKPLRFICVDFEQKALDHIKARIDQIEPKKRTKLEIVFFRADIHDLVKNGRLFSKISDHDLVYASGLLDYLGDTMAKKVISILFGIVKADGELIVVNAGLKDSYLRSYYELLGEWVFFHRSQEEMLGWVRGLDKAKSIAFEEFNEPINYHFLAFKKKR